MLFGMTNHFVRTRHQTVSVLHSAVLTQKRLNRQEHIIKRSVISFSRFPTDLHEVSKYLRTFTLRTRRQRHPFSLALLH